MEDYPGLYELLWFLGGVFFYRLAVKLLAYGHLQNMIRMVELECLRLLAYAAEDMAVMKQLRNQYFEESEVPENRIKLYKIADENMFNNWKENVITRLHNNWSKPFHGALVVSTWEGVLEIVSKNYKEQLWK